MVVTPLGSRDRDLPPPNRIERPRGPLLHVARPLPSSTPRTPASSGDNHLLHPPLHAAALSAAAAACGRIRGSPAADRLLPLLLEFAATACGRILLLLTSPVCVRAHQELPIESYLPHPFSPNQYSTLHPLTHVRELDPLLVTAACC
jgi:hypothetical protein